MNETKKKHHFALTHLTDIFERIVRIEIEIVEEKKHAVNTLNMRRKKIENKNNKN